MGIIERVHNSLAREKIYGILALPHLSNCQFFYVLNGLARFNEYYGHIPIDSLKIPPSRATLCPLIQRTDYVSRIYKSYNMAHPVLPAVTESGLVRGGHDTNIHIHVAYTVYYPQPLLLFLSWLNVVVMVFAIRIIVLASKEVFLAHHHVNALMTV